MDSIVLPTTLLEPRFRGSIRNLKYRDARSDQEQAQAMMAFKVMAFSDFFLSTLATFSIFMFLEEEWSINLLQAIGDKMETPNKSNDFFLRKLACDVRH